MGHHLRSGLDGSILERSPGSGSHGDIQTTESRVKVWVVVRRSPFFHEWPKINTELASVPAESRRLLSLPPESEPAKARHTPPKVVSIHHFCGHGKRHLLELCPFHLPQLGSSIREGNKTKAKSFGMKRRVGNGLAVAHGKVPHALPACCSLSSC